MIYAVDDTEWSYDGPTGPDHWPRLWPSCDGTSQSPIDVATAAAVPGSGTVMPHLQPTPWRLTHEGHALRLTPLGSAGHVALDGVAFELRQAHFHTPSEHHLDGAVFDAEMHLVCQRASGETAVIAVFLKQGASCATLSRALDGLPDGGLPRESPAVDLGRLLPPAGHAYRYAGSLTTPPCTEGVQWTVFGDPVTASPGQIGAIHRFCGANARPVQPVNGRPMEVLSPR